MNQLKQGLVYLDIDIPLKTQLADESIDVADFCYSLCIDIMDSRARKLLWAMQDIEDRFK